MNIIQAREAAMQGKTVISPLGVTWTANTFKRQVLENSFSNNMVFGKWSLKKEPVVFEWDVVESAMRPGHGRLDPLDCKLLQQFIGKRVKVTVECVE